MKVLISKVFLGIINTIGIGDFKTSHISKASEGQEHVVISLEKIRFGDSTCLKKSYKIYKVIRNIVNPSNKNNKQLD